MKPFWIKGKHADEMIRAILAGTKTQHRVPLKVQPDFCVGADYVDGQWYEMDQYGDQIPILLTYQPGDELCLKEVWALTAWGLDDCAPPRKESGDMWIAWRANYRSSWSQFHLHSWRPAITMPQWASRATLKVTGVRVERVKRITETDARAEGRDPGCRKDGCDCARKQFQAYWTATHGHYAWRRNPWVLVIEFELVSKEA